MHPSTVPKIDHALVVNGGRIVNVLPRGEAIKRYKAKETVDFKSTHCLLPGFVNAHTHLGMTFLRGPLPSLFECFCSFGIVMRVTGYADDKPLMEWLQKHIWASHSLFPCASRYLRLTLQFVAPGSRMGE